MYFFLTVEMTKRGKKHIKKENASTRKVADLKPDAKVEVDENENRVENEKK